MSSKVVANIVSRLLESENKTLDTEISALKPVALMVVKRKRDMCPNTEISTYKCPIYVHLLEIKIYSQYFITIIIK
jgi:hypothetical protein